MGSDYNKVILIGRVGADPVVRDAGSTRVANFSLATSEKFKGKDGENKEKTDWHRIVVWGKSADFAENYIKKGAFIFVEGQLRSNKWEDKDGNKRTSVDINASRISFLDQKKTEGGGSEKKKKDSDEEVPF